MWLVDVGYYCGCQVNEVRQLQAENAMSDRIVFRRATTKTQKIREVPISPKLRAILNKVELPKTGYL